MKTLRLIGMALLAVLMCVNFASCSNEEVTSSESQKGKEIVVSLGFSGDFEISESPLSRADSDEDNNLYIVEVKHDNSGLKYYASGVFDNVNNINVTLIEGEKYCFYVFIIKDGKTKLKNEDNTYGNLALTNSFTYSDSESVTDNLDLNALTLADGNSYFFPNLTIFYNSSTCTTRYTAVENENITISMERWAFGITFEAVNLIEGSLKVCIDDNSYGKSPTVTLDTENTIKEDIYYYPTITGSDEMNLSISVIWTKDEEDNVLGTPEITFKKNKMTTIKIIVNKSFDNGITFTIDNSELEDGGTYNVDGNTVTEE